MLASGRVTPEPKRRQNQGSIASEMAWVAAWMPKLVAGVSDQKQTVTIDIVALERAVHDTIRPAALLPVKALEQDPCETGMQVRFAIEANICRRTSVERLSAAATRKE